MWDGHELGERWSIEYDVVLRVSIDYFKLEDLPSKIFPVPEDDIETDSPEGVNCFTWYDTMESDI